jgi:hypothetical protein
MRIVGGLNMKKLAMTSALIALSVGILVWFAIYDQGVKSGFPTLKRRHQLPLLSLSSPDDLMRP